MGSSPKAREGAIERRHRRAARDLVRDPDIELYIGGWVESDSGQRLGVVDPTTGQRLATAQAGNAADVERGRQPSPPGP